MDELSLRSMKRILKKSGAKRVSKDACVRLKKILEEKAEKIAEKAWKLSQHANRRTLQKEDIILANQE